MKNITLLYLSILCFVSVSNHAQKTKVLNADKKYDKFAYVDAIKTYERVVAKGYKEPKMYENLGNANYFNSEYDKAAKWYDQLFEITSNVNPEIYYRYAQCLRSIGKNEKANEMLKIYNQKSDNSSKGEAYIKEVNYLDKIKANSGRYSIKDAGVNSKYSDYGSSFYNEKLVFTSSRDTGSLGQRRHTWTDQYFTNLYQSNLTIDSLKADNPKKFSKSVKSRFHEASAIFTRDGNTMYFTRNNFLEGKKGKNAENVTLIKLYKASFVNNDWTNIVELPFNSDNYSTAHPSLSPDEKTLYFVSNMPGTFGESDIFKVEVKYDGSFGTPQNLGKTINTAGKETFPFVTDENEIYFASDTHSGLGGLDVFVAEIKSDGSFGEVQNVGADVNSSKDDFAYLINTKNRIGFFSSNRDGGKGYDDIYQFKENKKLLKKCKPELSGILTESENGNVIPNSIIANAKVTLFNDKLIEIATKETDENGYFVFDVESNKTYSVRAEKGDKYKKDEKTILILVDDCKIPINLSLEKIICKVTIGDDLAGCFGIKWIYFDLDKSNIRSEAALDLAKILDVMTLNPTMKLDIRSHTDSRATSKYNKALSERRAISTRDWLIKNGVIPDRLTSKGYGETQLFNKCFDGVKCTEEEHQQNRRSEFIITGL
jgi:tetratricopeptide (TPR) repeat protein